MVASRDRWKSEDGIGLAVDAGVDALGFIFYEKSPRSIVPEEAKLIIEQLPPFVDTVGVFVDKKRKEVEEIIAYCKLGYAQLHGSESPKYCERLERFSAPCRVIKALRVGSHLTAEEVTPYNDTVQAFLLDTYQQGNPGGTGESFDWNIINQLGLQKNFLLAGGLGVETISQALLEVNPYGVDVNSGLEISPGVKDHNLIRQFVSIVRDWEAG